MTPVEFHFITPSGVPIVNATIEVQISQAGYDAITPGILMPRLLTVNTDALGKATISLVPSDIMYFVTAFDPLSDAALFYKFIVPPLAPGLTFVRLQDILVEGPLPQTPYDEAALLTILTVKANTLAAAAAAEASATTAVNAAATVGDAAAEAATATAQAVIAVTNAGLTDADATQTNLDRIATAADRVQTGLDRGVTTADRVQTALDAAATAADRVVTSADKAQTVLDSAATAADRVQTGLDRTAAAASAFTASTGASTATTKAGEADASAIAAAASAALAASTVTGVSTVNGRSGAVTLTAADVGLSNADNTSDANKPVSTLQAAADAAVQAAAVAASAPAAHVGAGGAAHANVVAAGAAGFMTGADKTKLDAITGTNTGDQVNVTGNAGTATALQNSQTIDGVAFNGTANITVIAPATFAAAAKATPVDADTLALVDSAASNVLKKFTWANLKTVLKAYFDTLYSTLAANTFTGAQVYSDQLNTRAMFKDCGLAFLDKGNSGVAAQTCDYTAGSHQKLTVTGAFVMNAVTNWPPTGNTGELLLELVNGASCAITWTMAGTTQKWWKADGTSVSSIGSSGVTLQSSGTDWILMWSTDAGATTNFKVMR